MLTPSIQPTQQAHSSATDVIGFTPYPIDLLPLKITPQSDSLLIAWSNGMTSQYHYIWLRANYASAL